MHWVWHVVSKLRTHCVHLRLWGHGSHHVWFWDWWNVAAMVLHLRRLSHWTRVWTLQVKLWAFNLWDLTGAVSWWFWTIMLATFLQSSFTLTIIPNSLIQMFKLTFRRAFKRMCSPAGSSHRTVSLWMWALLLWRLKWQLISSCLRWLRLWIRLLIHLVWYQLLWIHLLRLLLIVLRLIRHSILIIHGLRFIAVHGLLLLLTVLWHLLVINGQLVNLIHNVVERFHHDV